MEVTEVGEDFLIMRMPVQSNVLQPFGILHGGAVAALAENAGSLASQLVVGKEKACSGIVLQCNHLKAVRDGFIEAKARAIHLGRSTHVWEIEVRNARGELSNVCRLTMAVMDRK
jgi:1,4-dihydroxy-2-naphthoyl-CoA hydrolase